MAGPGGSYSKRFKPPDSYVGDVCIRNGRLYGELRTATGWGGRPMHASRNPAPSVLPRPTRTVAIERIADILVLGLGLMITALFLRGRLQSMFELVTWPQLPWVWIGICSLILAIAIYIGLRSNAASPLRTKLLSLITAFVDGLRTIVHTPERWRLVWTTALMWLTYGLMAYIPILMFDLQSSVSLSYWDGMAIMFIGVLGILVPTPGGAGSFHYITVLTLTAVYGIAQPDAAAYAIFVHGAQLFLYLATGALVLVWKPSGPSSAQHKVA